jgi:hypothetical protein
LPYPPDVLREGERMTMWELRKDAPRDLRGIFGVVVNAHVKEIAIRDPYCGSRAHRSKLKSFLAELGGLASQVEHVSVHCKEVKDRDGDVEFYLDMEREVESLLQELGIVSNSVVVSQLRGSGRRFHDREIDIVTVSEDGIDKRHRYFLTGGIDYLMDRGTETRVFGIRLDQEGAMTSA